MAVNPVYLQAVQKAGAKYGVPADLLAAQIGQESGWNPKAHSSAGATGISQFMPATAKGFGIDPTDPLASIDAQGKFMSNLYKKYGNWNTALAAYNAGSGNVDKYGVGKDKIPPVTWAHGQTFNYVKAIQAARSRYPGLAKGGTYDPATATTPTTPAAGKQTIPGVQQPTKDPLPGQRSDLLQTLLERSAKQSGTQIATGLFPTTAQEGSQAQVVGSALSANGVRPPTPIEIEHPGNDGKQTNPQVQHVIDLAKKYMGTPYKWGGADPKTGFDCSGLVQYAWKQMGINVPRTTYGQIKFGKTVGFNDLQAGDTVFFGSKADPHHEGLYIGNGQFIHSPHTGDVIKISNINSGYYRDNFVTAKRVGN